MMIDDPVSLIRNAVDDLRERQVLDVGCGTGALSQALASLSMQVVGLDPSRESLAAACRSTPQGCFVQGCAESLPFKDSTFDVVVFLNSLHHVPTNLMAASLREAARTTRPEGLTIVIEPLPEGTFFDALKSVEDETKVRNDAQTRVSEAVKARIFDLVEIVHYTRRAHGMFDLVLIQASTTARTGVAQWFAEFVATFGLLLTILTVVRFRIAAIPFAVGLYITAAYWFTSSTSFANPAVTIARALTATFSGIAPANVPAFIAAQLLGALAAMVLTRWLLAPGSAPASD